LPESGEEGKPFHIPISAFLLRWNRVHGGNEQKFHNPLTIGMRFFTIKITLAERVITCLTQDGLLLSSFICTNMVFSPVFSTA